MFFVLRRNRYYEVNFDGFFDLQMQPTIKRVNTLDVGSFSVRMGNDRCGRKIV